MRWKVYPKYKDSGVEWLGEIPEAWEIRRLKNVLSTKVTDGPHMTPEFLSEGVPFLSVDGIQNGELVFEECRFISTVDHEQFIRKARPEQDDILLGKAASTGKIARVKVDFEFSIWSPLALIRVDKAKAHPQFIEFVLKSTALQTQIDVLCTSNTQKNISMDDIPILTLVYPSLDEQHAIAAFLGRETERIDALIAKKKRQIELLQEKRAALISHAVTKGLDPNVKMKDSGIEWLGEIPAHWEVVPLRWYFQIGSGSFIPNTDFETEPTSVFLIPVIGGNGVMSFTNRSNIDNPTLVIGRVGAYCGNVHLVSSPAWITDNAFMLSRIRAFKLGYLALILEIANLNRFAKQNTQPLVTGTMVKEQSASLPPTDEQKQILEFINSETNQIKTLTQRIRKSLGMLCEYRTALITAAVTGKIDVREVVV